MLCDEENEYLWARKIKFITKKVTRGRGCIIFFSTFLFPIGGPNFIDAIVVNV
jgi:hypothetical protein